MSVKNVDLSNNTDKVTENKKENLDNNSNNNVIVTTNNNKNLNLFKIIKIIYLMLLI